MKKLLVVSTRQTKAAEEMVVYLRKNMSNTQVDYVSYDDMTVQFIDGVMSVPIDNGLDLAEYDLVYFKSSMAYDVTAALIHYVHAHGGKVTDPGKKSFGENSKLYSYSLLTSNKIAVPNTLFTMTPRLKNSYALYKEKLGLPFVLKDIHASRGALNEVIRNEKDFKRMIEHIEDAGKRHYLVGQAFVPNNGDYRILVLGGKVVMAIHRRRADDSTHLNNTSQGGSATITPLDTLPKEVLEDSSSAALVHGLGIAGVDMVQDTKTDRWYCFEVNEGPQMTTGSHSEAKWDALSSYLMTELENK